MGKMLRFTVFTVLATVAMLTEAAPGGGYYYKKAKKPAPAPAPATRTAAPGNLVEVAQKLDGFKTLVGLVVELGLVETLSNVEAATVFAPTDDAFAKVAAVLPTLTTEEKQPLLPDTLLLEKQSRLLMFPLHPLEPMEVKILILLRMMLVLACLTMVEPDLMLSLLMLKLGMVSFMLLILLSCKRQKRIPSELKEQINHNFSIQRLRFSLLLY